MLSKISRVLLILTSFWWFAIFDSQPAHTESTQANRPCVSGVYENRVFLCGEIDPEMLEVAEANLFLKGRDSVFIESLGGDSQIASEIANLLIRNKSEVLIGRRCYSACAQFLVFVDDLTILPWTQIGVHHNNIAFEELKNDFDGAGFSFDWSAIEGSARYTKFIARLTDTDHSLFTEAFDQLGVECHLEAVLNDRAALAGFRYGSQFQFWVPTRDQINSVRDVPIKGWWPDSWLEVAMSAAQTSNASDGLNFVYGSSPSRAGSAKRLVRPCS